MTYPTGIALTYTRNALGQVTAISENGTGVVSAATYLPFGPLSGLTYGNGVTETLGYDASYRATGVTDTGTAGLVNKLTYTLDAADNVSSIADGATPANNQSFTYNTRDRLLTAAGAYGGYTWAYDYNGNRSSEQLGANTAISYGYSSDRLTSVGSTSLGWLNDGVIAGITPSSGPASSFIINYGDRLLQSTIGGVGVETNLYDGMGDLFSRSTAGPPVTAYQYHYDLSGSLLEEDTNNAAQADYIWLGSRPVAVYNPPNGTLSYIHADRLGTPVKATNAAQGTVWTASYLPFGQATVTGTIQQNLRLPGMFAGPIGGYYHNGQRDYDYTKGRYNESDPINRWGGFNIYAYAEGNPLKYTDRSGLQVEEVVEESGTVAEEIGTYVEELIAEVEGVSSEAENASTTSDVPMEGAESSEPVSRDKVCKTYQTYTKKNQSTGDVYSGRTSGYGSPRDNVAARDSNHFMNDQGYGPAELDQSSESYDAIRGREQQLIDNYGRAQSMGGTSPNRINGVIPADPNNYSGAANREFGPLKP